MPSTWGLAWGTAFGAAFGALAPVEPPVVDPAPQVAQVRPVGGGHYDTGNGYVRRDHGWVKVTKVAKYGISDHWSGEAGGAVVAQGMASRFNAYWLRGTVDVCTEGKGRAASHTATSNAGTVHTGAEVQGKAGRLTLTARVGTTETLSMDEILAIFELMDTTA